MATQLLEIPVNEKLVFKSGQVVGIALPRANPIRRIVLDFNIVLKSGANIGNTVKNGGWLNLIKNIKIQAGEATLFSMSANQKFTLDSIEHGAEPPISAISNAGANGEGSNMQCIFSIDYSLNRKDLRALQQVLLPRQYSDLRLIVEWGTTDDLYVTPRDATVNEDKSYCHVGIIGAYNDSRDGDNVIPDNPPTIYEIARNYELIDREYTSLDGDNREIGITPTGNTILQQLLITHENITDGNPKPSDTVVRTLQFQDIRGGRETYKRIDWHKLKAQMKTDFYLQKNYKGYLWIDWADFRYGGLAVPSTEALKMQLTTKAPADNKKNIITVVERYI